MLLDDDYIYTHAAAAIQSTVYTYTASLTVDLCKGNEIISLKKIISPKPVGGPSKRKKNPGALGTCPVCPLVKTTLAAAKAWNDLPPTIRASSSLLTFRQRLKSFLFHTTFY